MFESGWLTKKGRTPEKARRLDRNHVPPFVRIAEHYRVVVGPIYTFTSFVGDDWYLYGIKEKYHKGPTFYFRAPWNNLPEEFWVRKVIAASTYYEFIPCDDRSALEQRYPTVSPETTITAR